MSQLLLLLLTILKIESNNGKIGGIKIQIIRIEIRITEEVRIVLHDVIPAKGMVILLQLAQRLDVINAIVKDILLEIVPIPITITTKETIINGIIIKLVIDVEGLVILLEYVVQTGTR